MGIAGWVKPMEYHEITIWPGKDPATPAQLYILDILGVPGFWLILVSWGKLIPPLLQIMFYFPRGKSTTGGIYRCFFFLLWPASTSQSCKLEYIGIFGMTWILNAINLIPQKNQDVSASKFPLTQSIDIVGSIPMISPSHISIQQLDWLPMAHASYLRHLQPNVWLLKSSFVLVKYHYHLVI